MFQNAMIKDLNVKMQRPNFSEMLTQGKKFVVSHRFLNAWANNENKREPFNLLVAKIISRYDKEFFCQLIKSLKINDHACACL